MTRDTLCALIEEQGGIIASGVSKKVNYVIAGLQDTSVVVDAHNAKSSKLLNAEALRKEGCDIKIIDSDIFLKSLARSRAKQ